MASMVALFSTLGENIPIFKREKILQAYSEGYINRLHYRATCLLIMAMTVMVTCPEWISGEGTYIGNAAHGISSTVSPLTTILRMHARRLHPGLRHQPVLLDPGNLRGPSHVQGDILTSAPLIVSLVQTCQDFDTEVGWDVSQTGVGPYSHNEDIKVKAYYQWVPFVLFLQVTISILSAGLPHTTSLFYML